MLVKGLVREDFSNYRLPSLFIGTSECAHNCPGCQNNSLKQRSAEEISNETLMRYYFIDNAITEAIVLGGLDPLQTFKETLEFYQHARSYGFDFPIVIYTGYTEEEAADKISQLVNIGGHLIVKYGRYIAGHQSHYDEVLGVKLASDNQYAKEYNYDAS